MKNCFWKQEPKSNLDGTPQTRKKMFELLVSLVLKLLRNFEFVLVSCVLGYVLQDCICEH